MEKKTITLASGKVIEVTIIVEADGTTHVDSDCEITEEEAEEIVDLI